MKVVLALDLGTTGNRVLAVSKNGEIVAKAYDEFPQHFPKPGWVEHNPLEIWNTTLKALKDVASKVGVENIVSIGIANQRETTILWDRKTGIPVFNAIVWQDRRTAGICEKLSCHAKMIKKKTGLSVDPYFSATKIQWLLDHVPGVRKRALKGEILFGTVDTWILWNLTGGLVHATDPSNASRTMCYNINSLKFDQELLDLFNIPIQIFPQMKESAGLFGVTAKEILGREIPVTGILGDQQASLFAQGGWEKGVVKNTYGTGLFVMTSTGDRIPHSGSLINTIAWQMEGKTSYAVEGSVFIAGSAVQWLRDGLKIIQSAGETEKMALSLSSNEGIYFVPALVGLGAPYWDSAARGLLIGLTRGTTSAHFVRAALEAMAYQTRDVIEEISRVMQDVKVKTLRVDGGATPNNFLMQFQSDLLNCAVERPALVETTGLGAAGIAGIASGFWSKKEFLGARRVERVFRPRMKKSERELYYHQWKEAVKRARKWVKG